MVSRWAVMLEGTTAAHLEFVLESPAVQVMHGIFLSLLYKKFACRSDFPIQ